MDRKNQTLEHVDNSFYSKSNFGAKGWLLIIFVGLMLYVCTALTNDGMNIAVPSIAAGKGMGLCNDFSLQHTGWFYQCNRLFLSHTVGG